VEVKVHAVGGDRSRSRINQIRLDAQMKMTNRYALSQIYVDSSMPTAPLGSSFTDFVGSLPCQMIQQRLIDLVNWTHLSLVFHTASRRFHTPTRRLHHFSSYNLQPSRLEKKVLSVAPLSYWYWKHDRTGRLGTQFDDNAAMQALRTCGEN
jgi:hypothetical protein